MNIARVVLFAAAFAAVVTIYSLRQLHDLTEIAEESADVSTIPTHHDWRMIAERAVQHVEHFPRHPFRSNGEDAGSGNQLGELYTPLS